MRMTRIGEALTAWLIPDGACGIKIELEELDPLLLHDARQQKRTSSNARKSDLQVLNTWPSLLFNDLPALGIFSC